MSWKMPHVERGTTVRWHDGGDLGEQWVPAIVTKVNDVSGEHARHVCLAVIYADNMYFVVKDGVHHHDDPTTTDAEKTHAGTWTYTDEHKRIGELQARVAALEVLLEPAPKKTEK